MSTCLAALLRPARLLALASMALVVLPASARAQAPAAVRDEVIGHFETSMSKFIALARAMPADKFTWSPGEGVMEVGHVYMHVAHYNYMYPSQNMGAALPAGVTLEGMEDVRDKERVVAALEASHAWVRQVVEAMSAAELAEPSRLYGRDMQRWGVLVQLVAHMNEHLGQSIAYARMNGVVPPWSR
jgi:uncharacterized damage-inducible protein DinB